MRADSIRHVQLRLECRVILARSHGFKGSSIFFSLMNIGAIGAIYCDHPVHVIIITLYMCGACHLGW
jgi:hypothetical protein